MWQFVFTHNVLALISASLLLLTLVGGGSIFLSSTCLVSLWSSFLVFSAIVGIKLQGEKWRFENTLPMIWIVFDLCFTYIHLGFYSFWSDIYPFLNFGIMVYIPIIVSHPFWCPLGGKQDVWRHLHFQMYIFKFVPSIKQTPK